MADMDNSVDDMHYMDSNMEDEEDIDAHMEAISKMTFEERKDLADVKEDEDLQA